MIKKNIEFLSGTIITDDQTISLVELYHCTSIPVEHLLAMVDYGILEPVNSKKSRIRWRFTANSILKVQTVMRLQRDLDVNMAGAALALELLDEIKVLRRGNTLDM